ncbi:uncharacterized protein EDB93DRAFT_1100510 [Suillus bovinus]|uniref:uncharacterized protein n=1 Tax=Suillus bovinus TaxID=48563 RepID=UPI001B86AE69|nr:uncharacterized protein EDB93DRAFT_1100510 [Suillus bovinus]KAG2158302.1 hypothetical protein EDB93DRAFT_1100510 [Suillus bovinus]
MIRLCMLIQDIFWPSRYNRGSEDPASRPWTLEGNRSPSANQLSMLEGSTYRTGFLASAYTWNLKIILAFEFNGPFGNAFRHIRVAPLRADIPPTAIVYQYLLEVVAIILMRRRDRRSSTHTQYSSTTGPSASKVRSSTSRVTHRQPAQRRSRVINKNRELEGEQNVGGEGFDDLIHWQDDEAIISFKQNRRSLTWCESSVDREGSTMHDTVTPQGTCSNTAPDDYVKDFLSSLRPNLESKVQEFKRIGLDAKTTLDAFIRWQASEQESWIFSQNLYLQLTPLEFSGLMLGIERLSDRGNGA